MRISREKLAAEAAATGFRPEILEKVARLLVLLESLQAHPALKGKLALKGGTALNLFVFDLPRLSVDIDLDYIGAADREAMLAERPRVEQALRAVFSREGLSVGRVPKEHAGGKWLLRYESTSGQSGNLEVDVNFMLRVPLWPPQFCDSRAVGAWRARSIPMLDLHELAAGKLAALLARGQARDLFDSHQLLKLPALDHALLRVAFVVYGAMNRKDWRTTSIDDVRFDHGELARRLIPTLRRGAADAAPASADYGAKLVQECRSGLSAVLPFTEREKKFLDLLLDDGEIDASLLTNDPSLQHRIHSHPMLAWKALHVQRSKKRG